MEKRREKIESKLAKDEHKLKMFEMAKEQDKRMKAELRKIREDDK